MNHEQIEAAAREAGASGVDYNDFTSRDDVMDAAAAFDAVGGLDTTRIQTAYREGRREHRAANGWVFAWTTAPETYDQFGTETVETHVWGEKTLRRVLAHPRHATCQFDRYWSGGYSAWDEDPRVTEARIRETIARENAEREEARVRREAGLVWIREIPIETLEPSNEDELDRMLHARGLTWQDARAERRRRADEQRAREQSETWAKHRVVFADGDTIVDDGAWAKRTDYGTIPARDANVWRNVKVEPHYAEKQNVELARIVDEEQREIGSLEYVVRRFDRGELRLAKPGEHLPTSAVLRRLPRSRLDEIVRVEVGGRVAWVGQAPFSFEILVLDEQGRKVRKREIVEAAETAWRKRKT